MRCVADSRCDPAINYLLWPGVIESAAQIINQLISFIP
jgi:hypothetical protein